MRLLGTKLSSISSHRGFGDQLYDLSGQRPSLDLQFANQKSLVDATTGQNLVTFTRASSGTYVDSQGVIRTATTNEARFDHNPTTGESLGLLVEESRTNLLLQSADISNAYWVKAETTVTANAITAPDGTTTAGKLVESINNTQHTLASAAISWAGNTQYTATFFAKAGERSKFDILLGTAANWVNSERVATFDLANGTVFFSPNSPAVASITPFANGWFRCRVTATATAAPSASFVFIRMCDSTGLASYQGIANYGLYLWGAQLEAGAFPTSYIPTTTATATRSADVASISGSNFSSWYRQDEGTMFADVSVLSTSKANQVISLNDGTSNNRVELRPVGSSVPVQMRTDCTVAGVTKYSNQAFSLSGERRLGILAIKSNDFRLQSGASGISPVSDAVPVVDRLYLNYATFVGGEINGTIRRLIYWPQRLSNSTLSAITQ